MLQMLSLLEGVDLKSMGHNSADYIHTIAETIKLAFADRERYYGAPAFVAVPIAELLSESYAAARRKTLRPKDAWPGLPPAGHPGRAGAAPALPLGCTSCRESVWQSV